MNYPTHACLVRSRSICLGKSIVTRGCLPVFAILSLSGCGISQPLQRANKHYTEGFAEAANEHLLLNIARVANDEPAYFVQLGNFNVQYSYGGKLGASNTLFRPGGGDALEPSTEETTKTTSSADNSATTTAVKTTTGIAAAARRTMQLVAPSLELSMSATPNFQFTPLSGEATTKALFSPLPNRIFSIIFSTWHADAAIRTAVNSIEIVPQDGSQIISHAATITDNPQKPIAPKPVSDERLAFTQQPGDVKYTQGGDVSFHVATTKDPSLVASAKDRDEPRFRWQVNKEKKKDSTAEEKKADEAAWKNIVDGLDAKSADDADAQASYAGAATATLKISGVTAALKEFRYRCRVELPVRPYVLRNSPKDPLFPLFLALAHELRGAQKDNLIPAPYPSAATKDQDFQDKDTAMNAGVMLHSIKLGELVSAREAGYKVEDQSKPGTEAFRVYKVPAASETTFDLKFPDENLLGKYPFLAWLVHNHNLLRCNLRSFDGILYQIAKEEQLFGLIGKPAKDEVVQTKRNVDRVEALTSLTTRVQFDAKARPAPNVARAETDFPIHFSVETATQEVAKKHGETVSITIFVEGKEPAKFQARPLLRLTNYRPEHELVSLYHRLQKSRFTKYVVGDISAEDRDDTTPSIANQTEFTLLAYLFSQASIDSTKLPAQQVFQVR